MKTFKVTENSHKSPKWFWQLKIFKNFLSSKCDLKGVARWKIEIYPKIDLIFPKIVLRDEMMKIEEFSSVHQNVLPDGNLKFS